jgi:uncharacterized protein (TIGR02996 family)
MSSTRAPDLTKLLEKPTLLIHLLSRHYPLARAQLDRYAAIWDWAALSENPALAWDLDLLDGHRDRFDWTKLCRNSALPWSAEFVRELAARGKCSWKLFSAFAGWRWTAEFIERHCDELDWEELSGNRGLPWSIDLLERFEARWCWDRLPDNLPWSLELLARFEHRWNWQTLARYSQIPWTAEWIDRFAEHLHWAFVADKKWGGQLDGIINSPTLLWTPELFARHCAAIEAHVAQVSRQHPELAPLTEQYWTLFCDAGNWSLPLVEQLAREQRVSWDRLSHRGRGLWTRAFIQTHREQLVLRALARNPAFPWTEWLDDFAEQLGPPEWAGLSSNPGFVPDIQMLQRYVGRWNWLSLSTRLPMTMELLEAFRDRWSSSFLADNPHLDIQMITRLRPHLSGVMSPASWNSFAQRRDAIALVEANPELPWDVPELARTHGEQVCRWISPSVVESVAVAQARARHEPRNFELETMIAAAPQLAEPYRVYADWLEAHGDDQHAQLIRVMLDHREGPEVEAAVRAYEQPLKIGLGSLQWRHGFVYQAMLRSEWQRLIVRRVFRFIEAFFIDIWVERATDEDFQLLRPLDRLRRLATSNCQPGPDAFAAVPALESLVLGHSLIEDLSPLAGRGAFRHLSVNYARNLNDIGPLAEVPNLTLLHLVDTKVSDLSPLRACTRLVELDIRGTSIADLSPLHEQPSLRRVFLQEESVDPDEVLRLQRAVPGLEIRNERKSYPWYWMPDDC